jgi:hypothetical protein
VQGVQAGRPAALAPGPWSPERAALRCEEVALCVGCRRRRLWPTQGGRGAAQGCVVSLSTRRELPTRYYDQLGSDSTGHGGLTWGGAGACMRTVLLLLLQGRPALPGTTNLPINTEHLSALAPSSASPPAVMSHVIARSSAAARWLATQQPAGRRTARAIADIESRREVVLGAVPRSIIAE